MKRGLMRRDLYGGMTGDPFREIRRMQYEMDRLMGRLMGMEMPVEETTFGQFTPAVESFLRGGDLVFKLQLPGIDPKDVDVTYDEESGQLVIKGERKREQETKEEDYLYRELEYGTFERRFSLPAGVKIDRLKAKFDKGILEITMPSPELPKARRIEIESGPSGGEKKKAA